MIDEILRRHGIAGPAVLVARQGVGAFTWEAGAFIVKIARQERSNGSALADLVEEFEPA